MSNFQFSSKLPNTGTSIFSVMSALSRKHHAINLSQGFPNFDCADELKNLVSKHMQAGHNQYAPMPGLAALRQKLAQKAENFYQAAVNPDTDITITAGATQAIYTAITAFIKPGDEVILLEPAYDSYLPSVTLQGGIPISIPLLSPSFRPDFDRIRDSITDKTKMIIINSPHNPSGTVWSQADMETLQEILRDTSILLLSDEVYEHLIYDGKAHQSALRYPELFERSLITYSFGKTFHNTGWKMGYCIAPENLTQEFRKVHQFNVFSVNTPIQHALSDYMEDPEVYLSLPKFYQQKRDFFLKTMEGAALKPLSCQGTYFQLFDYSAISDLPDMAFAEWLTKEVGVASIPLSPFYSEGSDAKVLRFCFAKTEEVLEEAGKLLVGSL